jgi:hypothetical protein
MVMRVILNSRNLWIKPRRREITVSYFEQPFLPSDSVFFTFEYEIGSCSLHVRHNMNICGNA